MELIFILAFCAAAWLIGVWFPWWIILPMVVYLYYKASKQEGLVAVYPLIGSTIFTVVSLAGCLYSTKVTYGQVGEWLSFIFTGGK